MYAHCKTEIDSLAWISLLRNKNEMSLLKIEPILEPFEGKLFHTENYITL
jgi:hypothetical protein